MEWLDEVLHYGLLAGAVFQLIAIAAIVVLPQAEEEEGLEDGEGGMKEARSGSAKGKGAGGTQGRATAPSTLGSSSAKAKRVRKRK